MPNIVVNIPEGVLDADAKKVLVKEINAVAAEVEQIGDNPNNRFLCWIMIEEIANGNWTCGGRDVSGGFVPVRIMIHLPSYVLNNAALAQYAAGINRAVRTALPHEQRKIHVSCMLQEVDEGLWSVNGTIWYLKDFTLHAGYKHLQYAIENSAV